MFEEIDEMLELHAEYAETDLEDLGFDIEYVPDVVYGSLPRDRIAFYRPEDDSIHISLNPRNLNDSEYSELETAIAAEILRANTVDDEKMNKLVDRHKKLSMLERSAFQPIVRIYEVIEREGFEIPASVCEYRDRLRNAEEDAIERLVEDDRDSTLDRYMEEVGLYDGETKEDIDFYKLLFRENLDYFKLAKDHKAHVESLIRHGIENSAMTTDEVDQAASLLLEPLEHGELGDIACFDRQEFIENSRIKDEGVEQALNEILENISSKDDASAERKFYNSVEEARESWKDG